LLPLGKSYKAYIAKFRQRSQKPHETIEDYATELKHLHDKDYQKLNSSPDRNISSNDS
jgi:hypothetical protein